MNKNRLPNIPEFIKRSRLALGKTQEDFADMHHCTKGNVSGWENGRHEPPYAILLNISKTSGVPLPDIDCPDDMYFPPSRLALRENYVRFDLLNVIAAAGSGAAEMEPLEVIEQIDVLESWATSHIGGDLSRIKLISARGTSMEGSIKNGEVLFVDSRVRAYDSDGIYIIARDGDIQVKRLQRLHGNVLAIISDNPAYESEKLTADEMNTVTICGRVLASLSINRFW